MNAPAATTTTSATNHASRLSDDAQLLDHACDERVEILERAVVHVGEVGTPQLLLVRDEPRLAVGEGAARAPRGPRAAR